METITVLCELNYYDLYNRLWSGAKEKWESANGETRELVWDRVMNYVSDAHGYRDVSLTDVNDLIWFECDDLFYPDELHPDETEPE